MSETPAVSSAKKVTKYVCERVALAGATFILPSGKSIEFPNTPADKKVRQNVSLDDADYNFFVKSAGNDLDNSIFIRPE